MDKVRNRNRRRFAIIFALVLMILGSLALFAMIQNCAPYIAFVKGEFYTPVANASETAIDRALSGVGVHLLRLALWPAIVFVALQGGATYAISTLVRFEGRFAATRRLAFAAGLALLMSAVLLAAIWSAFQGMISKS